ncbi:type VI secretion protein IcmF/TssM N-terminal domain-containing protein, partial [Klebsiella pneumoniae]|uniref:type VI secretion protein IcmF/TssM N-terminal domain-containing protein n=1 Tax=Klebsiella pneumoniae TaxID=573 RepID=UPI0013D34BFE
TTQDSEQKGDQKSWLSFLELLKENRPKQPINGVIVCISLEDLVTGGAEMTRAHAEAIRARLIELHDHLKV